MREGQMLARVRHPNVVTVHAVRRVGDEVGFVMDLIDGESLSDWVRRVGRLGAEEAVAIGETLCHALAAVHAAGVLHRDIKARNVMRDSSGRIMLMDFGAGRDEAASSAATISSGTPPYLAPELFQRRPASRASDIYSLGVLLYFLVSGVVSGRGSIRANDIASAHVSGTRRLLVDRRPDLPPEFIHVVERAIATDPARRYQSAGELIEDLHALVVRRPLVAVRGSDRPIGACIALAVPSCAMGRARRCRVHRARPSWIPGDTRVRQDVRRRPLQRRLASAPGSRSVCGPSCRRPILVLMVIVGVADPPDDLAVVRSAVPPVHRLASRVESTVSSVVTRRTSRDRLVLARWLLLAQIVVVVALVREVLGAPHRPHHAVRPRRSGGVAGPVLQRRSTSGAVNGYQALLPISAAVMALAWWRLIRSAGGLVALDRAVVACRICDLGAADRRRRRAVPGLLRRQESAPVRDRPASAAMRSAAATMKFGCFVLMSFPAPPACEFGPSLP